MTDWDRISKLIRLLNSDRPGEVVATAAALVRVLAYDSLTLDSLADRLTAVDTLQLALNNACRDIERLRADLTAERAARQLAQSQQFRLNQSGITGQQTTDAFDRLFGNRRP